MGNDEKIIKSALEYARSRSLFYKEIYPAWRNDMKAPLGIEEELPDPFIRQREQKGKASFVTILPGGRVWGDRGAVITEDEKLLGEVSYEFGKSPEEHSFFSSAKNEPEHIKGRVGVLSTEGAGYFHWLVGNLPRLHLITKAGIELSSIDRFIIDHGGFPFQEETLEMLGVGREQIMEADPQFYIEADEIVVPSLAWHKHHMPKWACAFLRDTFLPHKNTVTKKTRLFVSREDATERTINNHGEVLEYLEKQGFEKIIPGDMSIREQARIFNAAEVIIAPHGAGLTNIVFSDPGTKVIEIFSPHYVEKCFWILASQAGCEYIDMLGENTLPKERLGKQEGITVDIGKLGKLLSVE